MSGTVEICVAPVSVMERIVKLLTKAGRVTEAKWVLDSEGLKCKVIDPSHVALVEIDVPAALFSEWTVTESMEMGLDVDRLDKLLASYSGGSIELSYDTADKILQLSGGGVVHRMGLIEMDYLKDPKTPKIDLPVSLKVDALDLHLGLKSAKLVDELVILESGADGFRVTAVKAKDSVETLVTDEKTDQVSSRFDREFLADAVKEMTGELTVELGEDMPVRMTGSVNEAGGSVLYFLAPRVEGD